MKGSCSVDGIESILSIDQKGPLDILDVKDESHYMDSCFTPTSLTGTRLQRTDGVLDVIRENPQNGFGDDSSWNLTDANWPHSGALIQWQETTGHEGAQSLWEVQSLRLTAAREEQRSLEAHLNEEHSRYQAKASRPARPAAPLVLRAAFEIR